MKLSGGGTQFCYLLGPLLWRRSHAAAKHLCRGPGNPAGLAIRPVRRDLCGGGAGIQLVSAEDPLPRFRHELALDAAERATGFRFRRGLDVWTLPNGREPVFLVRIE